MKKVVLAASLLLTAQITLAETVIHINKSSQKFKVIESSKVIRSGSVSTGKKGHGTPTGTFQIHFKTPLAFSNRYKNAKMPNALFFIGGLYAIHAGSLPGYPASHGCVRVKYSDSKWLFKNLHVGTKVVIND